MILTKIQGIVDTVFGRASMDTRHMPEKCIFKVHLDFDEDAGVWYVSESDILGLSLEAATPADLINRIKMVAPELIDLNMSETAGNSDKLPNSESHSLWPVFDRPLTLAAI